MPNASISIYGHSTAHFVQFQCAKANSSHTQSLSFSIRTYAWCQTRIQVDNRRYLRRRQSNGFQSITEQKSELLKHGKAAQLRRDGKEIFNFFRTISADMIVALKLLSKYFRMHLLIIYLQNKAAGDDYWITRTSNYEIIKSIWRSNRGKPTPMCNGISQWSVCQRHGTVDLTPITWFRN